MGFNPLGSLLNRTFRNELNRMLEELYSNTSIDRDQFTMSKGKTYPFYSATATNHPVHDDAVYEMYIMNAEQDAMYKLTDISKDNTNWGTPVTYIRVMKSVDGGENWVVVNTRGDANLPNGQTGIKSHHVANNY